MRNLCWNRTFLSYKYAWMETPKFQKSKNGIISPYWKKLLRIRKRKKWFTYLNYNEYSIEATTFVKFRNRPQWTHVIYYIIWHANEYSYCYLYSNKYYSLSIWRKRQTTYKIVQEQFKRNGHFLFFYSYREPSLNSRLRKGPGIYFEMN